MTAKAEARRRLAELMDQRRGELRLRWRDVADAGGVSYEVVRAVRHGTGDIRLLTQRGIEDGLKWQQGSVQAILEGGNPAPLPGPALTLIPGDSRAADGPIARILSDPDLTEEEKRGATALIRGMRGLGAASR